jgi:hypothetical protein
LITHRLQHIPGCDGVLFQILAGMFGAEAHICVGREMYSLPDEAVNAEIINDPADRVSASPLCCPNNVLVSISLVSISLVSISLVSISGLTQFVDSLPQRRFQGNFRPRSPFVRSFTARNSRNRRWFGTSSCGTESA